jgi:hypothetical protein
MGLVMRLTSASGPREMVCLPESDSAENNAHEDRHNRNGDLGLHLESNYFLPLIMYNFGFMEYCQLVRNVLRTDEICST